LVFVNEMQEVEERLQKDIKKIIILKNDDYKIFMA
jgi:hypothetical protein